MSLPVVVAAAAGAVCWLEGSDNEEEVLPDAVLVFALPAPGVSHPAGDDVVFGLGFERLEIRSAWPAPRGLPGAAAEAPTASTRTASRRASFACLNLIASPGVRD